MLLPLSTWEIFCGYDYYEHGDGENGDYGGYGEEEHLNVVRVKYSGWNGQNVYYLGWVVMLMLLVPISMLLALGFVYGP